MPHVKEITLYIAPGCPHCPGMLAISSELVKTGEIARLEVVNISQAPEIAQQAGVRSVPYMVIGPFELAGLHNRSEIREWLDKAGTNEGIAEYVNQTLDQGQLDTIMRQARNGVIDLDFLLDMLADKNTPMASRIGISAVCEAFTGKDELTKLVPQLCDLSHSSRSNIRADAAYILGLTQSQNAIPCLEILLEDTFEDVRETAKEALEEIRQPGTE